MPLPILIEGIHGHSRMQATHHDASLYRGSRQATAVSLAGPHGTAQIRADDKLWDIVLAPSPRTASAGLTEDIIPVGDTVTASGHRHLDESTLEIKTERLTWNGKVFNVYPDRN